MRLGMPNKNHTPTGSESCPMMIGKRWTFFSRIFPKSLFLLFERKRRRRCLLYVVEVRVSTPIRCPRQDRMPVSRSCLLPYKLWHGRYLSCIASRRSHIECMQEALSTPPLHIRISTQSMNLILSCPPSIFTISDINHRSSGGTDYECPSYMTRCLAFSPDEWF